MFLFYLMTIEDEEERKSIEELYYKYRYQCFYMAKKYVSNDELAEDMVQETFVRIIKHRKEYLKLSCSEFEALLVTIIKNLAKDEYKSARNREVFMEDYGAEIISRDASVENKVILDDELKRVLEELKKMGDEVELMIYYRSLEIPTNVIAEMMGTTSKNVEMKLYRARKKLKQILKREKYFD